LSALRDSLSTEKLDICRLLLSEGADPDLESESGRSARDTVVAKVLTTPQDSASIRALKALFAISSDDFDLMGFTRLHKAVLGIISVDITADLQRMDSDLRPQVDQPDASGCSPLGWAVRRDDVAAARALIRAGADVNTQNNLGRTALMMAAESRYASCARHLIDAGADLCMGDHRGYTALHLACNTGMREVVRMLLAKGVDPDVHATRGTTALQLASSSGDSDVVQCLVDAGADLNLADVDGDTPLSEAVAFNKPASFRLLYEKGADYRRPNKAGETILHSAALWGNVITLETLASCWLEGLDMDAPNGQGLSPLQCFQRREGVSDELRGAFQALQRSVAVANGGRESAPDDGVDDDDDAFFDVSG
jgi:ankyrin repeat protein